MKKIVVPHVEPLVGNEELKEIKDCFKKRWITGGSKLKSFQEKIAKICKVKYAIGVCNGTQALYVALKALGVGSGDEVIVPDFTFIACSNAVIWTGAKPVFVDVDKRTFNIDPKEIKKAITKKTKAIMPVHIYGQPAEMDEIIKIAKKHNLYVIEDAAEALGAKYKGKPVGSFGHVACLSFYADKVITTGEGGMVLTNDPQIAKRVTILLNQGRMG
ncbi:MAG TPA: DegT/DnrJ/EryC1/StrS family aminotransferase, partial [bacterium]|nr:DegT/DnrJ/EryC1/StrS family aminotransferase [bacterium]